MEMKVEPNHFEDERSDYKTAASENKMSTQQNLSTHGVPSTNSRFSVRSLSDHLSQIHSKDEKTYSFEVIHECSDNKVKDVVRDIASRFGFLVRIDHQRRMLVEKYKRRNILSELCCCWSSNTQNTLVAIEISSQALKQKKLLTLRLLNGVKQEYDQLIQQVRLQIKNIVSDDRGPIITLSRRSKNCPINMEMQAYEFVASLLKGKYEERVSKFKSDFEDRVKLVEGGKKPEQLVCPLQMQIDLLVKTTKDIKSDFEMMSGSYNQQMISFAIERYLMMVTSPSLLNCYIKSSMKTITAFEDRRRDITSRLSNDKCMQYLQIKKRYQLPDASQPYASAIRTLSMIHLECSPRDKLKCIQQYYSDIKIACYQYHRGKEEISTMDDILPVMIYSVLKTTSPNLCAHIRIVEDYMKIMGKFQTDQRVITNLFVGLEYITKEWAL